MAGRSKPRPRSGGRAFPALTRDVIAACTLGSSAAHDSALRRGHKLLIAGNGGSAADAQHIAGEFLSRLNFDRNPLPAVALTTDSSVLTAIGNDYWFERTFERQVRGLGQAGDVFIAISTSGRSPNVIAALKAAREIGVTTVGFTGVPGDSTMKRLCDQCLAAPCGETPLIQQIHIVAAHATCGLGRTLEIIPALEQILDEPLDRSDRRFLRARKSASEPPPYRFGTTCFARLVLNQLISNAAMQDKTIRLRIVQSQPCIIAAA